MGAEDVEQAVVLAGVVFVARELVAAGTERAAGRGTQRSDVGVALLAGVDQLLAQGTEDAVLPREDVANAFAMRASGLNDAAGAGVDDRGDATGLRIEGVAGHGELRWIECA